MSFFSPNPFHPTLVVDRSARRFFTPFSANMYVAPSGEADGPALVIDTVDRHVVGTTGGGVAENANFDVAMAASVAEAAAARCRARAAAWCEEARPASACLAVAAIPTIASIQAASTR